MDALRQAVTRPAPRGRTSKLFELGLQQRSEVELNLGEYIERIAETDVPPGHLTSVSWSRSVVRPGLLTEAPEAALTSGNVLFVGVVSRCWAVFDGPATAQTARAPSACLRPNLPERLNKVIGDLCHSFWPIRMP